MRRLLAIALVLLFWLPSAFALLPGAAESNLPACCRRHGVHHCAMETMSAAQAGPGHSFDAQRHCPLYWGAARTTISVFVPPAIALQHALTEIRVPPPALPSAAIEGVSASSGRGPPSLC